MAKLGDDAVANLVKANSSIGESGRLERGDRHVHLALGGLVVSGDAWYRGRTQAIWWMPGSSKLSEGVLITCNRMVLVPPGAVPGTRRAPAPA